MAERCPVVDWENDFDHLDPRWTQDPYPIWEALRLKCPVAQTQRFGGVYLPTRYADIRTIAYDPARFSSRQVLVREGPLHGSAASPPMTSDPPFHREARMVLMEAFHPAIVTGLEETLRESARAMIAALPAHGCDLAESFARPFVRQALTRFLGLPERDAERFTAWVHDVLDPVDQARASDALAALEDYLAKQIARRRYAPGPGVLGHLLNYRHEGHALNDRYVIGSVRLLILAGNDTTAGSLGAAIWHLAQHTADRQRLVDDPGSIPQAVEEVLRFYAPSTMAREVVAETEVGGIVMTPRRMVMLCFPAANRDPDVFPDADQFHLDRHPNRHLAFGAGIHRCIGDGLARLIIRVGLSVLLDARPAFTLDPNVEVVWTAGSVRGPLQLPVVFDPSGLH